MQCDIVNVTEQLGDPSGLRHLAEVVGDSTARQPQRMNYIWLPDQRCGNHVL